MNTQITDDVDTDKSIKKITHNVVIGQAEQGVNRVQSSCIFHTLKEARGYQILNGGTLNVITRESETITVEIVESYPEMNDTKKYSFTQRLYDMSM